MITMYSVCLLIGIFYSVASFILNDLFTALHFDTDFDIFSLPLKPFTIMTFVTVFGATGLITLQFIPPIFTLVPAIFLGYVFARLLYNFVYLKLKSYETETSKERDALSLEAEVVEKILPGSFGKISYIMDGNTLSAPAKEQVSGNGIAKGTKVTIVDMKDNVCYVEKVSAHQSIKQQGNENIVR